MLPGWTTSRRPPSRDRRSSRSCICVESSSETLTARIHATGHCGFRAAGSEGLLLSPWERARRGPRTRRSQRTRSRRRAPHDRLPPCSCIRPEREQFVAHACNTAPVWDPSVTQAVERWTPTYKRAQSSAALRRTESDRRRHRQPRRCGSLSMMRANSVARLAIVTSMRPWSSTRVPPAS
jgi:hypothetical protein